MDSHTKIKLEQLSKCAQRNRVSKLELSFLKDHMHQEDFEQLMLLLKEKKIKHRCSKGKVQSSAMHQSVLSIFNQPQFAAELAVYLAKTNKQQRIAIIDSDRFHPVLDLFLNANSSIKTIYSHLSLDRATGLNLLIDSVHKSGLSQKYTDHMAIRIDGYKNLYYFSGSYLLEDYEYFKLEDFQKVLEYLKQFYDVLIIATNGFLYDAFTCYGLMFSTMNIMAVEGQLSKVLEVKRYLNFLSVKQNIPKSKNYYVMFDYKRLQHMKEHQFKEVVDNYFLGNINYHARRHDSLIGGYMPTQYQNHISKLQYQKLIGQINKKVRSLHEFS